MFTRKKNAIVQAEMDRLTLELKTTPPEEYDAKLKRLEGLSKLKEKSAEPLSPNTVASGVVNLLGIAMIIRHENLNVITTKALGFVTKIK